MNILSDYKVSKGKLTEQLSHAFDTVGARSIALHTDLLPIGIISSPEDKNAFLENYADVILKSISNRTLLLPTFNYSYCKTRVYNTEKDKCQVGLLNEYFRKSNIGVRTLTPVFNFYIINNNKNFQTSYISDPFGENSTFAEMVKEKTWVGFLGIPCQGANTLLHHAENILAIGYRYKKIFSGHIKHGEKTLEARDFAFRVHPITPHIYYDFDLMVNEFIKSGIFYEFPLGFATIQLIRADEMFCVIEEKFKSDELYFLDEQSKEAVKELYTKYGNPILFEKIE